MQFLVAPKIFKDFKFLSKKLKLNLFECFNDNEHDIDAYKIGQVLKNTILNSLHIENFSNALDRQRLISKGWKVFKFRSAVDKEGKSKGLRVFYAINTEESIVILLYVNKKRYCPTNNQELEDEVFERLSEYIVN
mgnify:CR=1 FL=1